MRKLTALLLTMMLALCLTACAGNDTKKLAGTWTYSADITSRMNEEIKAALELDEVSPDAAAAVYLTFTVAQDGAYTLALDTDAIEADRAAYMEALKPVLTEALYSQAEADGCARIGLLAEGLNVRPSSASKMVYQLRTLGLVAFEKYGLIQPTEKGWSVGRWLLHRHEVLHRFFCMLNGSTDELELVEQVEHYLNEGTVRNLEALLERLEHGEG